MSERVERLVSVNVGMPRKISWQGRTVFTGIWKEAVQGSRQVRRMNVEGTAKAILPDTAVSSVPCSSTSSTRTTTGVDQLRRDDFVYGQFGENLTVDGLRDDEVCIGDQYRIGSVVFEVTQPRVTCYRVGIRMNEPRMAALLTGHGRPGFYCRVLHEGALQAGDHVVKVKDGEGRMTIAAVNALLYLDRRPDPGQLGRALRYPRSARVGARRCLPCSSSSAAAGRVAATSVSHPSDRHRRGQAFGACESSRSTRRA